MKIEVWSDVVCPFCYIGKRRLEEALAQFRNKERVEVIFKGYQLDPDTPAYDGQNYYEMLTKKFRSETQVKLMTANISQQGKSVGITFDFDHAKVSNTFDAHRLTKYAKTFGKDLAISERLFKAHFSDAVDVGDANALARIAEDVGLSRNDALDMLKDKQAYAPEVKADIAEANQLGISAVPYFIINRKYALSGAQPVEAFIQALSKASEDEKETPMFEDVGASDDESCGGDGCLIP